MGAAGRDFHNFNVVFRDDPSVEVVAFTAAQIPDIEGRTYPPVLSGPLYPDGIEIYPEEELARLVKEFSVDEVCFSYSDVSHEHVMHEASLALAMGADFRLLGPKSTMLRASRPVISVCAVRTGCGKSAVTRLVCLLAAEAGKKAVAVRHPMPYGDLASQRVQRFPDMESLDSAGCTIEEREEYEHLIGAGVTVFAGVDYAAVLAEAEKEADLIVWDGGNNDMPFFYPDLEIVVADPLRPGHELSYYPGEANLRRADVVVINKVDSARAEDVEALRANVAFVNPGARTVETDSPIEMDGDIKGKKVLVVEDGPTLTHGGMAYGAGYTAALREGAAPVDPRPYAVGSIKETLDLHTGLKELVPAMGYGPEQIRDLKATIEAVPCDAVLVATPIDLTRVLELERPAVRVSYGIRDRESPGLADIVKSFIAGL